MSDNLFGLEGQTALVMGLGGVLGRRSALILGRRGARVVVVADHPKARSALDETAAALTSEGVAGDKSSRGRGSLPAQIGGVRRACDSGPRMQRKVSNSDRKDLRG